MSQRHSPSGIHRSVAIFSSRETTEALVATVEAVLDASHDADAMVDVIINGNRRLGQHMEPIVRSLEAGRRGTNVVRLWYIALGDKAHAWNQYLTHIWPESRIAFFLDGYVQIMPAALRLLDEALASEPHCLAASGVPTMGRSAKTLRDRMLSEGGIHGNLYAVRGDTMAELRDRGFRLPMGLYRSDGLLGAVICFGLDPGRNSWDARRILVHPEATWTYRPMAWWRAEDLVAHFKRMLRQAQGSLESLAIRDHLEGKRSRPEALPKTASDLVRGWRAECPRAAGRMLLRHPVCVVAARRLSRRREWRHSEDLPVLLATAK